MPKFKPHSGIAKRVRVTGTGKITHEGAGKRHNLEKKPTRVRRRMTGMRPLSDNDVPRVKRMLGL